jgi:hypothetical protein
LYTPGKLLFFDPFYFKNTNSNAPKFFLVLKAVDDNVILASLPSSQKHLPTLQEIKHGCLEIPDACINCYIFEANKPITKNGWSFDLDTMLYGNWIDDYIVEKLEEKYPIEGVDYDIIGELKDDELIEIIKCFKNSKTVKRRYKNLL